MKCNTRYSNLHLASVDGAQPIYIKLNQEIAIFSYISVILSQFLASTYLPLVVVKILKLILFFL